MIRGVLSIGTNSTRALVADLSRDVPEVLLTLSTGTRIGEGLKEQGQIRPEAAQRTLDALAEFTKAVRERTNEYCAIATSALRRAANARWFAGEVERVTGAALEIISGEEEARRSFTGALAAFRDDIRTGVLDLGGGSAEYAVGSCRELDRLVSCEIGAVRLTEALPALGGDRGAIDAKTLEQARAMARTALEPIAAFERVSRSIFVGGTATTVVGILQGERRAFSYEPLNATQLDELIERFARTPLEQRKQIPGINPQRADILLAGMIVLRQVMEITGRADVQVSTNDLLLGTLLLRKR